MLHTQSELNWQKRKTVEDLRRRVTSHTDNKGLHLIGNSLCRRSPAHLGMAKQMLTFLYVSLGIYTCLCV